MLSIKRVSLIYIVLSTTIIQMENALSGSVKLVVVFPLVVLSFIYLLRYLSGNYKIYRNAMNSSTILYGIWAVFLIMAYLKVVIKYPERGEWAIFGAVVLLATFFLVAFVVSRKNYDDLSSRYIKAVLLAPVVYVVINLLLFLVGVKGNWTDSLYSDYGSGSAVMLGSIGVDAERVRFYLANGVNSFAPVAGLSLLTGYYGLKYRVFKRSLAIGAALCGLVALMLVDSRGAIVSVVLGVVVKKYFIADSTKRLNFVLVGAMLYPMLLYISISVLVGLLGADLIGRGGDAQDFNSRGFIWSLAIDGLANFDVNQIFGYGFYGHHVAGLTDELGNAFRNKQHVGTISLHNGFLQTIYDVGYMGLLVFMLMTCSVCSRIMVSSLDRGVRELVISSVVYLFLVAGTEVSINPYGETLVFVVILTGLASGVNKVRFEKLGN